MVKVILVDKNGDIKETTINNFSVENLFKKCSLRKKDNFEKRHTWKFSENNEFVSLFSKDKGRANNENKYDLPPPVDSKLYFGKMLLVCHGEEELVDDNALDLTENKWKSYYEKLFGGFEDLNDEDSFSEEEEIPEKYKTKEGYSKEDGFIIDDDEEEDEEYIPDDEEEEESAKSTTEDDEELMGEESELDDDEEEEDDDYISEDDDESN